MLVNDLKVGSKYSVISPTGPCNMTLDTIEGVDSLGANFSFSTLGLQITLYLKFHCEISGIKDPRVDVLSKICDKGEKFGGISIG